MIRNLESIYLDFAFIVLYTRTIIEELCKFQPMLSSKTIDNRAGAAFAVNTLNRSLGRLGVQL